MLVSSWKGIRRYCHEKWNEVVSPTSLKTSWALQWRNHTKNLKHLGWNIKHGSMSHCESFAKPKAKKENITKSSKSKSSKIILAIKPNDGEETILRNNWHSVLDGRTCYRYQKFMIQKWYSEANMCSMWEVATSKQTYESSLTR